MKDPSSGAFGTDPRPGSPSKQSSMSRALAPSADDMISSAVIGSTASRYSSVKSKRQGYFIDSTLGQSVGTSHRAGTSGTNGTADNSSGSIHSKHSAPGNGGNGSGSSHLSNMLQAVSAQQQQAQHNRSSSGAEERESMHVDTVDKNGTGGGSLHTRTVRRNSPMV